MNARAAGSAFICGIAPLFLAACSYFSTEPDPGMTRSVHASVPRGTLMDAAESNLIGLGFACGNRQGDYEDEGGTVRSAPHFLLCERRPGTFSFNCEHRDRVVVIPTSTGKVDDVEVSRGPSCSRP